MDDIRADPGSIEQILMNLAVNARDAMPSGGQLIIETANLCLDKEYAGAHLAVKTGPHAMLAVTDTGTGMSEEVGRVFSSRSSRRSRRAKAQASGLATVYGIVQQMEGSIWVYSELGKGTTFKILFPRRDTRRRQPRKRRRRTLGGRAGRSEFCWSKTKPAVRKFVRRMLEKQGYTVVEARRHGGSLRIAADRE